MQIILQSVTQATKAQEAIDLLKNHLLKDWAINKVEMNQFNSDVELTVAPSYKNDNSGKLEWNIGSLLQRCDSSSRGCRAEIDHHSFLDKPPYIVIRFYNILVASHMTVIVLAQNDNKTVLIKM